MQATRKEIVLRLPAFVAARSWRHTYLPGGAGLAGFLVCVGYYFGSRLGFALTLQPNPVSVLWPPNSILLAGLLLTPVRWWCFIILAVIPAHWGAQLQSGVPQTMILCWFLSNCCEALLGAACLRYLGRGELRLDSFGTVGIFIFSAVFLAPFLSSFLDAAFVALNRWGESSYWEVWRTRFFSNALAALTLVSVIVSWSTSGILRFRKASRRTLVEAGLLILGLILVQYFVFVRQQAGPGTQAALLYAPLPLLLWAAMRFGVAGTSVSILAVALVSISATAHGQGPFASRSPAENALSLQVFLIFVSIPFLSLAAALEERQKAEQALRSNEELYREVVETQTELICRYLPDTTLTFVNDAYCRFFNSPREELIGLKFIELIPETGRDSVLKHTASLVRDPRVQTVEHEVLTPNGTHAWHQWVHHAIRGPGGEIVEFQGIGRDISDRKRAEEANQKLAHVSRLAIVGELTASIAHEINQPLGAILSNADAAAMLLEANPNNTEDVKQILADIRKDDVRASDVIRHIQPLLRNRRLEMEMLDMNRLASEVIGLTRAEARKRRTACEMQLAPALPMVQGDKVHLQQVLLNLVLNAMDAMVDTPDERRRLTVFSARHAAGGVEMAVRDAGGGIPRDRFARLFESFFTTKKEGMGLGLFISRVIIEAHQGQIWAENNVGPGATFRFVLPRFAPLVT
jgi:two-component system, LuxR family, sensor kinase FixL